MARLPVAKDAGTVTSLPPLLREVARTDTDRRIQSNSVPNPGDHHDRPPRAPTQPLAFPRPGPRHPGLQQPGPEEPLGVAAAPRPGRRHPAPPPRLRGSGAVLRRAAAAGTGRGA